LLRAEEASGEQSGNKGKTAEMREKEPTDVHENSPCVETRKLLPSYA
jgi:hypothetical protein